MVDGQTLNLVAGKKRVEVMDGVSIGHWGQLKLTGNRGFYAGSFNEKNVLSAGQRPFVSIEIVMCSSCTMRRKRTSCFVTSLSL
jgi:hypothetical protein